MYSYDYFNNIQFDLFLYKAHTLIKEKKINYGDELTSQLRKVYRQKQEKQNEVRQNQQITLLVNKYCY